MNKNLVGARASLSPPSSGLVSRFFWPVFALAILLLIVAFAGADFSQVRAVDFLVSLSLFLLSMLAWGFAWAWLLEADFFKLLPAVVKGFAGVFSPLGVGSDVLRAFYAQRAGFDRDRALAASIAAKLFKLVVVLVLFVFGVYFLSVNTIDFVQNSGLFQGLFLALSAGLLFLFFFFFKSFAGLFYRASGKLWFLGFYHAFKQRFFALSHADFAVVLLLMLLSSALEFASVYYAFLAVGQQLPLLHVFI